ncbi:hypothetical protein J3R83DRAFT_3444 [Lanmaoa asiatica]|nr:hypothetical protein J3R83DRAFT_3444 [Lanmaoa asiatica]
MGNKKRKQDGGDEEDDLDHGASNSDAQPEKAMKSKQSTTSKTKAPSKQKTTKKPKFDNSGDESSPTREESKQPTIRVLKNAEGEKYVDLGKKKRAAVRSYKGQSFSAHAYPIHSPWMTGQVYVDVREFYSTDGDEKPGRKGISLAMEQWEALKRSVSTIDSLFAEQGTK